MFIIFLFLGIFTHLLLLYSIFDIYYSSPIVKGGRNFKIIPGNSNNVLTPADRIVFFSADGLRARSFFDNPEASHYIHSLIDGSKAVWGISEGHVPTESRPGHVALFAGFYEDVSAVTRGWKHNPIPFDSTFNQSEFSFLWGSPDIINLFSTNIPHSFSEFYSPELEDFASEEASKLDEWVFDKVEEFFNRAKQGDNKITKLLSIKRDGTPDEVQTPFVAWGSGIAPTKINLTQVDIAPLQSALLGIAIPSNSFGIVPINLLGHLPDKYIFQSVYANFKQMSEQFLIRRAERRAHSFRFLFCEYPELSYEGLVKIENEIIRLAQLKRYEAAWKITECRTAFYYGSIARRIVLNHIRELEMKAF
uniref:GPI ethanolamine phosphate transferase 1 n=1 Tax=Meloidogyne javanica TaxID=6303 RepID=A0A915MCE4_MELJA